MSTPELPAPIARTTFLPGTQSMLAARTSEAIGRPADRRTGVVVSFTAGVLTVSVAGGDPEEVGYLSSYEPRAGDTVELVLQRSTWVCNGRLAHVDENAVPSGALSGGHVYSTFTVRLGSLGGEVIVPSYDINVTVRAGDLVGVRAVFRVSNVSGAPATGPFVRIRHGDGLAGAQVYSEYATWGSSGGFRVNIFEALLRPAVTGSQRFVLTAQNNDGAGWSFASGGGDGFVVINYGPAGNVSFI